MQIDKPSPLFEIVESLIWPNSLIGWLTAALLSLGSLFLYAEFGKFLNDYVQISNWEMTQGYIITESLDGNKISIEYKYKIGGDDFIGNKIGVSRREWHDVSGKQASNFKHIYENSIPISIKYNPNRKTDAVYDFNSDDVFFGIISILPPTILFILFATVFIKKIKRRFEN